MFSLDGVLSEKVDSAGLMESSLEKVNGIDKYVMSTLDPLNFDILLFFSSCKCLYQIVSAVNKSSPRFLRLRKYGLTFNSFFMDDGTVSNRVLFGRFRR